MGWQCTQLLLLQVCVTTRARVHVLREKLEKLQKEAEKYSDRGDVNEE